MSTAKLAHLTDRGVMRIAGSDAVTLLDGLVTNSLGSLDTHAAIHTGLLSPQGKILFDFFIVPEGDGLLVETERSQIQGLTQRLTFYRLRADVTFEDLSDALA
ncbi:MAG: YgfZ/GcvT domain-containing protein, partial [Hyphomicrobiaceae bacterium]